MSATNITYNSYDLQDSAIVASEIGDGSGFRRKISPQSKIRRAGVVVTDDTFETKIIPVMGTIFGTSLSNLDSLIDDFNAAMAVKDKNLDIDYEGGTRRYVATPRNFNIDRPIRGNWAKYRVDFLVTEYGKDTSSSSLLTSNNNTTSGGTHAITVDGSAPEQYLTITIDLNTFTGAAINTVTVGNNETGQAVSISRAWTGTDTLVIDVENQRVKVEGVEVDYSGAFPEFVAGPETISYDDDFTARNYNINATYFKRWL